MKKVFLVLLLFIGLSGFSQIVKPNYVGGNNNKLVLFAGFNFNDVANDFTQYLHDDFDYTESDKQPEYKAGHISLAMVPKISSNASRRMLIKWQIDTAGTIQTCTIEGWYDDVVKLFVMYWPTRINFETAKQKRSAVCYLVTDKISLTTNLAKRTARIVVEKNK